MELCTMVREVQSQFGITNSALGRFLHCSEEMISKIRAGERRLPVEALPKLAALSPMIGLQIYSNLPNSTLSAAWLDGDVDLSVLATTEKLREELGELVEDLGCLKLVNKTCKDRFTVEEFEQYMHSRQEAMDAMLAIAMWLVVGAQAYGIDMEHERKEHRDKLAARRYIKKAAHQRAVR